MRKATLQADQAIVSAVFIHIRPSYWHLGEETGLSSAASCTILAGGSAQQKLAEKSRWTLALRLDSQNGPVPVSEAHNTTNCRATYSFVWTLAEGTLNRVSAEA